MPPIKNDRFLRAIWREPVDKTPVWIMRQAGRYLPEYRATRARAGSFMTLCKTPELACEVTLQPLARYPLDAAIIFSDILTIPDAMGMGLEFVEQTGPVFAHLADFERLAPPPPERLSYVYEAIKLTKKELAQKVPLIGFCGSPWTLAAYIVEGKAEKNFPKIQKMRQENPNLLHKVLNVLEISVFQHLKFQLDSGADALMIFDTWGGLLGGENYAKFSLNYLKNVISALKQHYNNKRIPIILFTKGGALFLDDIAASGCDVVGLDWEISLHEARARVGHKVALQGNMDPAFLLKTPPAIEQEVARLLQSFGKGSGHIFNLGHGITPDVPPEHVATFVNAVHDLSKIYHTGEQ